jgi:hypothetical protein
MVNGLERVADAQDDLIEAEGTLAAARALDTMRSELRRIDDANLIWALRDYPPGETTDTLIQFERRAKAILAAADAGDDAKMHALLVAPEATSGSAIAHVILAGFDCHTDNAMAASDGAIAAPSRTGTPAHASAPLDIKVGVGFLVAALTMTSVALGMLINQRVTEREARRGKRYPTHKVTTLMCGGERNSVVMQDLSCRGAKFRHGTALELTHHQPVALKIGGKMRRGRVSWSNTHYCGMRFNKPLRLVTVLRHIGLGAPEPPGTGERTRPETKTAPTGDAVSTRSQPDFTGQR